MKKEIETKFYEFNQTNSGGFFDVDDNICHRVIIEAVDAEHARSILKPMIENQSSSCACCGDRWSIDYCDEIDLSKWKKRGYSVNVYDHYKEAEQRWFKKFGKFPRLEEPTWKVQYTFKKFEGKIYFETIEEYCQYMANEYGWTTPDVRIHFLDGTKKEIFKIDYCVSE